MAKSTAKTPAKEDAKSPAKEDAKKQTSTPKKHVAQAEVEQAEPSSFGFVNTVLVVSIVVGFLSIVFSDQVKSFLNDEAAAPHRSLMDHSGDGPYRLYVHPNGNPNITQAVNTSDYADIDDLMEQVCPELEGVSAELCAKGSGVRLYKDTGLRLWSLGQAPPNSNVHCVAQGRLFVWPIHAVGYEFTPESVESPIPGKKIVLKQLSVSPNVISVSNFMSKEEIQDLLDSNRDRVKPSEVGFSGKTGDSTRTSSTSWDFNSKAAASIMKRSFDVLGLDFIKPQADAVQVLNYKKEQWYKPHVDWFNKDSYATYDPVVNNGTNRFATVFLYLNTVPEGGYTVFPLSRTHEGYNGEYITEPNIYKNPGYINTDEAKRACEASSPALKSIPVEGNAVIFYSQNADSSLDPYSLHGGCPPVEGEKWSANVWIWNRPKPGKDKALDKKKGDAEPAAENGSIDIVFHNRETVPLKAFWVNVNDGSLLLIGEMEVGNRFPVNTFIGHEWVFQDLQGNELFRWKTNADLGKDVNVPH